MASVRIGAPQGAAHGRTAFDFEEPMTDDTPPTGRPTREAALLLANLLARLDADAAADRP